MKPLTNKKPEKKFEVTRLENKSKLLTPVAQKKVAQCCAKNSRIVSGCHD